MRNKLAFDVLDKEMFSLMKSYQYNLSNRSDDIDVARKYKSLSGSFYGQQAIKGLSDEGFRY